MITGTRLKILLLSLLLFSVQANAAVNKCVRYPSGTPVNCVDSAGGSIGGAVTGGTAKSILFVNPANVLAQDNAHFIWDDATYQMALGSSNSEIDTLTVNTNSGGVTVNYTPSRSATGGTITNVAGNEIHTFTTTGQTFTPNFTGNVTYLVVAGGGGGSGFVGGGGGAGGVKTGTLAVTASTGYTITVGAGGTGGGNAGQTLVGGSGGDSIFSSITSTGGGGGADNVAATNGGSGGGGANGKANGTGLAGQGNDGGVGFNGSSHTGAGGGGGGAGAVGAAAISNAAGNGGVGTSSSISGSAVFYGGGGGGCSGDTGTPGTGGNGGGGAGKVISTTAGTAGTANTGGGGGGGYTGVLGSNGGAGGSGIVIISFVSSANPQYVFQSSSVQTGKIWTDGGSSDRLTFTSGTTDIGIVNSTGWLLGGTGTPTARLNLVAGSTSVAPMKWTSGSLNTTPVAGYMEFLTDKWYGTITTGTANKEFTMNDTSLTSGKTPVASTNGRLIDSALTGIGVYTAGVVSAGSGGSGKAVCWKTTTTLGSCSTIVDAAGACTCV